MTTKKKKKEITLEKQFVYLSRKGWISFERKKMRAYFLFRKGDGVYGVCKKNRYWYIVEMVTGLTLGFGHGTRRDCLHYGLKELEELTEEELDQAIENSMHPLSQRISEKTGGGNWLVSRNGTDYPSYYNYDLLQRRC
jgi:hypothetical protein